MRGNSKQKVRGGETRLKYTTVEIGPSITNGGS